MNGVKAKSVHVVRETRRAADARDDDEVFALDAEFGEDRLDGGENGVVATAGAPADFLVGLKIFFRQDGQCCRGHLILQNRRAEARHYQNRPPWKAAATETETETKKKNGSEDPPLQSRRAEARHYKDKNYETSSAI